MVTADKCQECQEPEHEVCPLKEGCTCCADTRLKMANEEYNHLLDNLDDTQH